MRGLLSVVGSAVILAVLAASATPAPAAFPGGNGRIAFVSKRDGNYEIYAMNADGSGQTNLTRNPRNELEPVWSPDGRRIAFDCARELCTMNGDGSGLLQLTESGPTSSASGPAWSPDGTRIAYIRSSSSFGNSEGPEQTLELFVMNADGSAPKWLAAGPTIVDHGMKISFFGWRPTWSPDGARIAFDGVGGIQTIAADGTDLRHVTTTNGESAVSWSPDGTRIAFTSDLWTTISIVNADGSGRRKLGAGFYPAWSPDGSRIAYAAEAPGGTTATAIWTMNADGTDRVRLTSPGTDTEPNWQPLPGAVTPKPGAKPKPARAKPLPQATKPKPRCKPARGRPCRR